MVPRNRCSRKDVWSRAFPKLKRSARAPPSPVSFFVSDSTEKRSNACAVCCVRARCFLRHAYLRPVVIISIFRRLRHTKSGHSEAPVPSTPPCHTQQPEHPLISQLRQLFVPKRTHTYIPVTGTASNAAPFDGLEAYTDR